MAAAPVNRIKWYTAKGKQLRLQALQCFERRIDNSAFYLKFEEAAHFYYRAAVAFRAGEKWAEAAQCLQQSAGMHVKLKLLHQAALLFSEASEIWLKINPFEASRALEEAIELYNQIGNFELAGILQARLGSYEEERNENVAASAEAFDKAAKLLIGENIPIMAEQCLFKAALLKAQSGEFGNACQLFELCAQAQIASNLRRFNAHDALFRGLLCLLAAGDADTAQYKLVQFDYYDFTFQVSAERQFIQDLLWLLDNPGEDRHDRFADMVYDFDKCVPFDSWAISILGLIWKQIALGARPGTTNDEEGDGNAPRGRENTKNLTPRANK